MASDSFGSSVRSNMLGTLLQYNSMRERRRKISESELFSSLRLHRRVLGIILMHAFHSERARLPRSIQFRSNVPGTVLKYNTVCERRRKISIQTSSKYCRPKNSKQPAAAKSGYTHANGNGKEKLIDLLSEYVRTTVQPETSQCDDHCNACDRHFDPRSTSCVRESKASPPVSNRRSSSPVDHHIGLSLQHFHELSLQHW